MNPPANSLKTQARWNQSSLVDDLVDYLITLPTAARLDELHRLLDRYIEKRRKGSPDVAAETLADERDILLGRVLWNVAVWQHAADGGRADVLWRRDLTHFIGKCVGNA